MNETKTLIQTYTMFNLKCSNCGWRTTPGKGLEIRKGHLLSDSLCPKCDCATLRYNGWL